MAAVSSLVQPTADKIGKVGQVVYALKIEVHLIPVDADILMDENVAGASQRGQLAGEGKRQDTQFTKPQNRLVVVTWLLGLLQAIIRWLMSMQH